MRERATKARRAAGTANGEPDAHDRLGGVTNDGIGRGAYLDDVTGTNTEP